MTGEVVNLRLARKRKLRAQSAAEADANRAKHGRTKAEKQVAAAEEARVQRAHQGRQLVRDQADEPLSQALCSRCLASVPMPTGIDLAALVLRTVYATDDLVFPAAATLGHPVYCHECSRETIALVVQSSVADSVAARR